MAARLTAYLVVAIVGVTFIAGLIVGAQRDDSDGPVDLIIRNGAVYAADQRGTTAEAVAVRGNRILRVGSNREIDRLQRPQTLVLDARGGSILPGFNDAQVRLFQPDFDLGLDIPSPDESSARQTGPAGPPPPSAPSTDQQALMLRAAIAEANAHGITSVQNTVESADTLRLYDSMRRAGELTLRIYAAIPLDEPLHDGDLAGMEDTRARYADDPLFKAGALSIDLDGSLADRTAALNRPYFGAGHEPDAGTPSWDPDELNRTVRLADAAGWQIITHATGDRAVHMALNAYAHAARSNRPPDRGRRHRIDGIALVDPVDVPRFAPLGVVASMQPARLLPTEQRIEWLTRSLGEARARRLYPMRTLAASTRLVFGSGWPETAWNPLLGLHVATTRTGHDGSPDGGWPGGEQLPLTAAVKAYTSEPAWASFDEQRKGTIAPGMLADLVVLSRDIFDIPQDELLTPSVAMTIFDGKVVYRRIPREETAPLPQH